MNEDKVVTRLNAKEATEVKFAHRYPEDGQGIPPAPMGGGGNPIKCKLPGIKTRTPGSKYPGK